MNASSVHLLRAESTGPSPDKIVPKIRNGENHVSDNNLAAEIIITICMLAGQVLLVDLDWMPLIIMTGIAVVFTAVGFVFFRKRDLVAT